MVDKVQKIREEVARIQLYTQSEVLKQVLDYIDEVQKEEIPPKFPIISQKKCMYTKDHYTDEDRKVLCEDCKEKCEYNKKEEPVSEDEIEKYFSAGDVVVYVSRHPAYSGLYLLGNPNDLSIGYSNANEPYQIYLRNCTIASEDERKQFMRELNLNGYKWNENTLRIEKKEEPVSDDLGEYINELSKQFPEVSFAKLSRIVVRVAKWQKEQLMVKAFDFTKEHNTACVLASECLRVHGWFNRERDFNDLFRHLSCVDELFAGKFSGKTKVIVIKED